MNNDALDKIEKLSTLKDNGILTDEEFNSKKQILLNSLTSCSKVNEEGTYWLPIPSMILGTVVMSACFDEGNWDQDTTVGAFFFIILSLTLGIISISVQQKGKGLAIAGITLSIFSALIIIGSIN